MLMQVNGTYSIQYQTPMKHSTAHKQVEYVDSLLRRMCVFVEQFQKSDYGGVSLICGSG